MFHADLFIYGLAIGVYSFPLVLCTIPLFRNYDPMQKLALNVWHLVNAGGPSSLQLVAIKVVASGIYVSMGCKAASVVYTVMLFICLMMTECCICLSSELYPAKDNLLLSANSRFFRCFHIYRVMQILMQIYDLIVFRFLTVLVTMGTLSTAWGGYVMLTMYGSFPLVIYMSCSVIFFFCLSINFLLVTLAGIPSRNGRNFHEYWCGSLRARKTRLLLRSCPEIGFHLACVKHVKFVTALEIANLMINATMTLVLTKINDGKSWT